MSSEDQGFQHSEEFAKTEASDNIFIGTLNNLFKDLSESDSAIVVLAAGASRQGKSTIVNCLCTDCPPPDPTKLASRRKKWAFKENGGTSPCTKGLQYAKISASDFRYKFDLPGESNFDIFFVDTEGFGNIEGCSPNLFLSLFSLLGIACVQLFVKKDVDESMVVSLSQNITISRIFDIEYPPTIINARGSLEFNDNYDDDDDEKTLEEMNDGLYINLQGQDERNLSKVLTKLKEKVGKKDDDEGVFLSEENFSLVSLPDCNRENTSVYLKVLKKVSEMILRRAKPCSGKELIQKFASISSKNEPYSQALANQNDQGEVQVKLIDLYISRKLSELESDALVNFRLFVHEKDLSYAKRILDVGPECDPKLKGCLGAPYELLLKKLESILPGLDKVDSIHLGYLDSLKTRSIERMGKSFRNEVVLMISLGDANGRIYHLYKNNESLDGVKPGNIVTINLIDSDGKKTDKQVKVRVLNETFEYEYEEDGVKKIITLHHIFPVGIRILRLNKNKSYGRIALFMGTNINSSEPIDITEGYHFDFNFNELKAIPKDDELSRKSTYYYQKESVSIIPLPILNNILPFLNKIALYVFEENNESSIKVSMDDSSDFIIKSCDVINYDNTDPKDRKTEDETLIPETVDPQTIVIRAKEHRKPGKTNDTKITFINFELK